MGRHSISGSTFYVIKSTGGRAVVTDTNLSQPVSVFELACSCILVISASSRVLNIFSAPAMQNSPLGPSYDWNVLTHPNEQFDHFWLHQRLL